MKSAVLIKESSIQGLICPSQCVFDQSEELDDILNNLREEIVYDQYH